MLTSVGCLIETKSLVKKYQLLILIDLVKVMAFNIKIVVELLPNGLIGVPGLHVQFLAEADRLREVVFVKGQMAQIQKIQIVCARENQVEVNHALMIVARFGTLSCKWTPQRNQSAPFSQCPICGDGDQISVRLCQCDNNGTIILGKNGECSPVENEIIQGQGVTNYRCFFSSKSKEAVIALNPC